MSCSGWSGLHGVNPNEEKKRDIKQVLIKFYLFVKFSAAAIFSEHITLTTSVTVNLIQIFIACLESI